VIGIGEDGGAVDAAATRLGIADGLSEIDEPPTVGELVRLLDGRSGA